MKNNGNEQLTFLSERSLDDRFSIQPYFGTTKRDIKRNVRKLDLINQGIEQLSRTKELFYQSELKRQDFEFSLKEREATHIKNLKHEYELIKRDQIETEIIKEKHLKEKDDNAFNRERNAHFLDTLKNERIDPNISAFISAPVEDDTKVNLVRAHYEHTLNVFRLRDERSSFEQKYRENIAESENDHQLRLKELSQRSEYYRKIGEEKLKELRRISSLDISDEEKEIMMNNAVTYFDNLLEEEF